MSIGVLHRVVRLMTPTRRHKKRERLPPFKQDVISLMYVLRLISVNCHIYSHVVHCGVSHAVDALVIYFPHGCGFAPTTYKTNGEASVLGRAPKRLPRSAKVGRSRPDFGRARPKCRQSRSSSGQFRRRSRRRFGHLGKASLEAGQTSDPTPAPASARSRSALGKRLSISLELGPSSVEIGPMSTNSAPKFWPMLTPMVRIWPASDQIWSTFDRRAKTGNKCSLDSASQISDSNGNLRRRHRLTRRCRKSACRRPDRTARELGVRFR